MKPPKKISPSLHSPKGCHRCANICGFWRRSKIRKHKLYMLNVFLFQAVVQCYMHGMRHAWMLRHASSTRRRQLRRTRVRLVRRRLRRDTVVIEKTALIKAATIDAVNAFAHKLKAWGAVHKAGSVLHSQQMIHAVCGGCKMKSSCQGVYTKVWIFAGGTSSQILILRSQLHPLKKDFKEFHCKRCFALVASCRDPYL